MGNPEDGDSLTGVRVSIDGLQWPIVVAWRSEDSFAWMMDAVKKAESGTKDKLNVRVTCIAK